MLALSPVASRRSLTSLKSRPVMPTQGTAAAASPRREAASHRPAHRACAFVFIGNLPHLSQAYGIDFAMELSREVRRRLCALFVHSERKDFAALRDDCCLLWSNERFPASLGDALPSSSEQLESLLALVGGKPVHHRGMVALPQLHVDWIELRGPDELDSPEIEMALWKAQQCADFEDMGLDGWRQRYRTDMDVAVRTAEALACGDMRLAWRPVVGVYAGAAALYRAGTASTEDVSGEDPSRAFADARHAPSLDRLGLTRLRDRFVLAETLAILRRRPALRLGVRLSTRSARCDHWWASLFSTLNAEPGLAARLVVEFAGSGPSSAHESVRQFCARLQACGARVAIRDFGSRRGDLAIVHACRPDIVKLDRSLVRASGAHMRDALMPKLVDLLHESGMFVVAEGIETSEDLMLAARSNVDFVQGYLFGMPSARLAERGIATPLFESVFDALARMRRTERLAGDLLLLPYRAGLTHAARRFASGATTGSACAELLALQCTLSCFFLDEGGREFMPGLAGAAAKAPSARFAPIADPSTGRWDNRPYFVDAHAKPQQVITSAPYLSVTGTSLCVTLTIATQRAGKPVVIGADLDWRRLIEAAPAIF